MNWIAGAAGLYFVSIAIAGAVKRKREGVRGIGRVVRADDIYNHVLQNVWRLKHIGEITISYGYGFDEYFSVYMYGNEYIEGVVVDWRGKRKKVKLPYKDAINNEEIVARAIMSGFAQLYLGKDVDPYQKPDVN